ncbi:MAG: RecX family transcriptional regulator [Candidatus Izimaplasma sp.]|nr:RecX family transcriptional regulator [Candidatus Izimaplasma bacterium]
MNYKVLSIEKNKNKYKVVIEKAGEKISLTVSEDIILDFRLLKDKELTEKEYKNLVESINRDKYYQKLLYYANYKPRTAHEAKNYLDKFDIDEKAKHYYLNKLEEIQLLNDDLYVRNYIYEYSHYRLIGPKKIIYELRRKGISPTLINKHINDYKADLIYRNIVKLVEKKAKSIKSKPFKKTIQLIKSYIVNKGYDFNLVQTVINDQIDLINEFVNEEKALDKDIEKYYTKYKKSKQKSSFKNYVVPKLLNKGYQYGKILKILEGDKYGEN